MVAAKVAMPVTMKLKSEIGGMTSSRALMIGVLRFSIERRFAGLEIAKEKCTLFTSVIWLVLSYRVPCSRGGI